MFQLTDFQQQQIKVDAMANLDREVCGLILRDGSIVSCDNTHEDPLNHFRILTSEYAKYEPLVAAIYHSHVNDVPNFTAPDVDLLYAICKPLILYSLTRNHFRIADLSGEQPLIDREFLYGVYDCYSLVADYYQQNLSIKLGKYPRSSDNADWDKAEWDWIDRQFEVEGFYPVRGDIKTHDVLAMSLGDNNRTINHLGVYTGDNLFMHQLCNRKSRLDVWGHPWREYTIKVLRYG